jgi:hypothetical protein
MRHMMGVLLAALATWGLANVNLDLRPDSQTVYVGDTVYLKLYAVSDTAFNQYMAAMDVILKWDSTYLNPLTYSTVGAGYSWFQAGFLYPGGLNSSLADGDAIWTCFASPGNPAPATPPGLLVCTFSLKAKAATPGTVVSIPRTLGGYTTVVYDGTLPNTDITGTLDAGAVVQIILAAPVTGHVLLDSYMGGAGIGSILEFRAPGTQTVLYSTAITLDALGNYTAPKVPVGTYDVALKVHNWLRQVRPGVVVALPSTAVDFSLQNGDAYEDNSVDLLDLGLVLTDFAMVGTPPLEGDVNWDGSVDLVDLGIVLTNFASVGDP